MDSIITVNNLSKEYRIGGARVPYSTLREAVSTAVKAPFKRFRSIPEAERLWALRDVDLDVKRGEVLGVIGHNGAGKSTLLKILSRVTEPTTGRIELYGRVGSLLEVGTGFHPELTGRENLYLNGAILGMARSEIARKFDAIAEFAEIEKFLDTPVKYYSSGMYVRLAFSVAIHLEPQILLVDEVLAVGDLSFQQKCLRQMNRLRSSGMTILLVSHNMAAVQSICRRVIYLERGTIAAAGEPADVIDAYRNRLRDRTAAGEDEIRDQVASADVGITDLRMFDEAGKETREFRFGEAIRIRIELDATRRIESPMINFGFQRGDGVVVGNFNNWYDNFRVDYLEGKCVMEGWLPPWRIVPDFYTAHALVWNWGGGHLSGDLSGSAPIAWKTFGSFRIHGIGLNSHDGVVQTPALKWRFSRGGQVQESPPINADSIFEAFGPEGSADGI